MSDHVLYLYGEVGDYGITADQFRRDLETVPEGTERVTLRLNSPGGSVFDGIAIYNLLKAHPAKVHVVVDGLAASIASLIAMAADEVSMAKNSMMMVHLPWTIAMVMRMIFVLLLICLIRLRVLL